MDIYMIWVKDSSGAAWLVESWDEDSISMNSTGWEDAKARANAQHAAEVRVIKAAINFDRVLSAFDAPRTTLDIKENNA